MDCLDLQQLLGRYRRLEHELTIALEHLPGEFDHVQRLAVDFATTREVIAKPALLTR